MSAAADPAALTRELLDRCRGAGFILAGICDARPVDHAESLRAWLAAGRHGEMGYMAEHVEERIDPDRFVPGARSIICVADRYHDGRPDRRPAGSAPGRGEGASGHGETAAAPSRGRIARYARGRDYHEVMRERLEPIAQEFRTRYDPHRFRVCVDTAPILERDHAARAGLGRIGKHTLLIGEGCGSWILLGEIVTTMELVATSATPPDPARSADPCGSCTRCIDACPTRAITPWSVDATRCISYLTIEHAGEIDPDLAASVDDWIFGCDVCQEVCPHNQPTRRSRQTPIGSAYRPTRDGFDLLDVLGWTEESRESLQLSGVLMRASLSMMKRNAANVAHSVRRRRGAPPG